MIDLAFPSKCAYCFVPAVRGREQSRRPGEIVAEVTRLATFAGLQIRKADAQLDHNLRTLIIAPDGTVAKTLTGNQWQPAELVAEMKRLAR